MQNKKIIFFYSTLWNKKKMACYCELKTEHNCPEMLKSFEEQYEENLYKIEFDPQKVNSDLIQKQIADDINEVKANKFNPYLKEERIVKFNAVVSYFPQEFNKKGKEKNIWDGFKNDFKK